MSANAVLDETRNEEAAHLLRSQVLEMWRPPERQTVSRWAVEHVRMPALTSAMPGRFNLDAFPYEREPLDALSNDDVRELSMMWATQLAKTTIWSVFLAYVADVDPGPALIVGPVESSVKDLMTTRLYPMMELCGRTRHLLPPKHQQLDLLMNLRNMLIFTAWTGSVTRLGEKSIRYLIITEIDKGSKEKSDEADSIALALSRTKAFPNHKRVFEGSPTIKGTSRIERSYNSSDRRQYHVPCPHCGRYGTLEWTNVKWPHREDGHSVSPDEARESAWYECPHCDDVIRDVDKPRMLRKGVWLPKGQRARFAKPTERAHIKLAYDGTRVRIIGKPENPNRRHRGYHLSSLYSPLLTFGDCAQAFLKCGDDWRLLQDFWNAWLALPWEIRSDAPEWHELRDRLTSGHRMGVVPREAKVLIASADVHKNRVNYIVRAWTVEGKSWLIWHGVQEDLDEFAELVTSRTFALEGGGTRPVNCALIDARYRTSEVDEMVNNVGPIMRAVMGDGEKKVPFKKTAVEVNTTTGRIFRHGYGRWMLNSDLFKEQLVTRQSADRDNARAWLLHDDVDEIYLRQITAEVHVMEKDRRNRDVWRWVVRDIYIGNHFFDCECYNIAGFQMWSGGWAGARTDPKPKRKRKPRRDDDRRGWDGTIGHRMR